MIKLIQLVIMLCFFIFMGNAYAYEDACGKPKILVPGSSPSKLIVIVPATGQGAKEWESFEKKFISESESDEYAWMVYEHGIEKSTLGYARNISKNLSSCINSKNYKSITLIGHSIGGMIARYAYLYDAGAFSEGARVKAVQKTSWSNKVEKILLFASVNRGVDINQEGKEFELEKIWWKPANWFLRVIPHPRFILEDVFQGSDFIADIRIAWIRYFGELNNVGSTKVSPRVVQYWGTSDSTITKNDNADIGAFNDLIVIDVPGAKHGDLQRLESKHVADSDARWELFRQELFEQHTANIKRHHLERKVLIIAHGIRDSSNSEWFEQLAEKAREFYDEDNIVQLDYGYFSALKFAMKPSREKNIPEFRDLYTEILAENPLTKFDFIGHSNGTYILGHSLFSTSAMKFRNVLLAAPVLPTNFEWLKIFKRDQIESLRYDTANGDWPVGILCQALNAVGFDDVGTSGLDSFGKGAMQDAVMTKKGKMMREVGPYNGGHNAALQFDPDNGIDNLQHLLEFASTGNHYKPDIDSSSTIKSMGIYSRATPYVVWAFLFFITLFVLRYFKKGGRISFKVGIYSISTVFVLYGLLDVI